MGLEVRYGRGGELRKHWYAALVDSNGKRKVIALTEPLPARHYPGSLKETGDAIFEASRARAQKELEAYQSEARQQGRADHLTARLIESKTGQKVENVKLVDLAAKWRGLRRETKPGAAWLQWCDTVFARFAAAVPCEYLHEVAPEQAAAYVETLRGGCSRKTQQDVTNLLRSAFRRLLPPGAGNPFEGGTINRKGHDSDGGTVHRRPFTAGELAVLFEAARPDPFLYPLVVCAACTGLRLGDVCGLRWQSVDLRAGILSVKTSKTGASVQIPIFDTLRAVLETALAEREPDAVYVWPDAARMHKVNPTGLTWRFKKLVASIMADPEEAQDAPQDAQDAPGRVTLADVLPEVLNAVQAKLDGLRRDRVTETLSLYSQGVGIRGIESRTGRPRSTVSADLHRAEELSGLRFMPEQARGDTKGKISRLTRLAAPGRAQRASVSDWHSLRTTWVTLALAAGVPIELCKLVTGHQTVAVVMKHYFHPQVAHLRAVLGDKLPGVLTGNGAATKQIGAGGTVEGLAAQLKTLSPADRAALQKLLKEGEQ